MKSVHSGAIRGVVSRIIGCGLFLACVAGCGGDGGHEHGSQAHHVGEMAEEFERGPHRGRMVREGNFAVELQIFETGVPPQYRVFGYVDSTPLDPALFTVAVELHRLGRSPELFSFRPLSDFQVSDKTVEEPHSFEVVVTAQYQGKSYSWRFSSYEGRTTMTDDVAAVSGLKTERATEQRLHVTTRLNGRIRPSEHRIAHVMPRFSGVIREGRKHIGDTVTKGEVLAVIESNQSLQPFEVRSHIAGTVIEGHVVPGEFVPENTAIYTVADFSEMWVDCYVPLREGIPVAVGQRVILSTVHGERSTEGAVLYVAPYADEHSQSRLVRLVITNQERAFLPGMYLSGDLIVAEKLAPVAVKREAIQTFRDGEVVFRKVGSIYEIAPIERGITDGEWAEVVAGLMPGDEYVTENSFLVKADILKAGASHDH